MHDSTEAVTHIFLPFYAIYANNVLSPDVLRDSLEKWCTDKPGASFAMAQEGAWLTMPIKYLGLDITIGAPAQDVSISFKPGPSETK